MFALQINDFHIEKTKEEKKYHASQVIYAYNISCLIFLMLIIKQSKDYQHDMRFYQIFSILQIQSLKKHFYRYCKE